METDAHGNYAADAQELQTDWDEKHGIEHEMDTTDGLGAQLENVQSEDKNEPVVKDGNGHRIRVGEEVHVVNSNNFSQENFGTITSISDPDGDMNEYNEQIEIPPVVHVDFKDGTDEEFTARYVYPDHFYEVDDIEAL